MEHFLSCGGFGSYIVFKKGKRKCEVLPPGGCKKKIGLVRCLVPFEAGTLPLEWDDQLDA